eukprot:CAMPEP_0182877826 /NCGR_PEP_ID=MMETSP0034_2-20130328/14993_1 /TAXON_ID=156128 /ORGANISM="Nephroselmis pyriformis, Strain CCMP717" /LENGTH=175 /DNA_ID=CAMNT_0025010691 /DNA_START=35 /DNA_END=559 /DNA_ORIENTATION=+
MRISGSPPQLPDRPISVQYESKSPSMNHSTSSRRATSSAMAPARRAAAEAPSWGAASMEPLARREAPWATARKRQLPSPAMGTTWKSEAGTALSGAPPMHSTCMGMEAERIPHATTAPTLFTRRPNVLLERPWHADAEERCCAALAGGGARAAGAAAAAALAAAALFSPMRGKAR